MLKDVKALEQDTNVLLQNPVQLRNFHVKIGKMNNFNKKIEDILNLLSEDRCKSRADKVYGKKTSAYKSGAIVRCRKGKIWKKNKK
jgi:hypothetical protein